MNRNQTTFLIFGQGRSGSALLKELLNSHPDISCDGELFNKDTLYIPNKYLLRASCYFPLPYIIYRQLIHRHKVYGFTLFNFHVKRIGRRIKYLSDRNWKIIYIRRTDTLQQAFSNIVAHETDIWHRRKGEKTDIPDLQLNIPEERLLRQLRVREKWLALEREVLDGLPFFEVVYEDMLEDNRCWQETMQQVFGFLGVDNAPVSSKLLKTYPKPYPDIVANYGDLIQTVKNSPFSYMLRNAV